MKPKSAPFWTGKTVLITGGTGSFGKKFIEIMLKECQPRKLIILSRDELKQHEMKTNGFDHDSLRYFIGDVRDKERLMRAFAGVDVVVHAAALKQVPTCEYNPMEAIQTNVLGARNVIDAAIDCGVKQVVALSTDKAVNPVNLYGATKLCAEKLFIHSNAYAGKTTQLSCVRYGNVVGSRGSVLPIFIEQAKMGRLSITDERMTRFWITLDAGVRFAIECAEVMGGGEVFIPKIPSMKVVELAKVVGPNCKIELVGIRPGEKLHEVLVSEDEARHAREQENMYVIMPENPAFSVKAWNGGQPAEGFRYASDKNKWWMTPSEMNSLIEAYNGHTEKLRAAV